MSDHVDRKSRNSTSSNTVDTPKSRGAGRGSFQFADNRLQAVAQRKLQEMANNRSAPAFKPGAENIALGRPRSTGASNSAAIEGPAIGQNKPIQMYALGPPTVRSVTIQGASGSRSFEECLYNSVEYKKGDAKRHGSPTVTPAKWATWLVNKKGGNNATQLHVVNARWGGLGGQNDKNIVPGTPAENSHHLHEAEKKFDQACFGSTAGATAIQDAKYECHASPHYGQLVDVSGGAKDFADPSLAVTITASGVSTHHPVTPGADGLTMKEGT